MWLSRPLKLATQNTGLQAVRRVTHPAVDGAPPKVGSGNSPKTPYYFQRSAALWSLQRPSTQRGPSLVSSFFQNGARVFR